MAQSKSRVTFKALLTVFVMAVISFVIYSWFMMLLVSVFVPISLGQAAALVGLVSLVKMIPGALEKDN